MSYKQPSNAEASSSKLPRSSHPPSIVPQGGISAKQASKRPSPYEAGEDGELASGDPPPSCVSASSKRPRPSPWVVIRLHFDTKSIHFTKVVLFHVCSSKVKHEEGSPGAKAKASSSLPDWNPKDEVQTREKIINKLVSTIRSRL